ncbi:MAG: hypothetical protein DRP85_05920 [Candidatus Makaraimicrobium thalassicum]|nr:MAG: hypothetical protein DRP85_05920 [Candidatus Omnitrophota bacterium]
MRKTFSAVFVVMLISAGCMDTAFAGNWYAINRYHIANRDGGKFQMRTVTKVSDEDTAGMVADLKEVDPVRAEWIGTCCVSGEEYDEALQAVFSNSPVEEAYISFIEAHGYETRVDFLDVPAEYVTTLAEAMAQRLKDHGGADVRVIYPVPEVDIKSGYLAANQISDFSGGHAGQDTSQPAEPVSFTVGSGEGDVKRIQGAPSSVIGNVWFYDYDIVVFDCYGKVNDYTNFSGKLRIAQ